MADQTPADLLREAAELMRQRAQAATVGPWDWAEDGLVWANRLGDPVSGSTEVEDAEHIASWHPTVALAVAHWLDIQAGGLERGQDHTADTLQALKVARAYLGKEADRG